MMGADMYLALWLNAPVIKGARWSKLSFGSRIEIDNNEIQYPQNDSACFNKHFFV